ncbi:MAG: hypothetical protein ACRDK0_01505, partial [Solirubrobacteraceae bacterium]
GASEPDVAAEPARAADAPGPSQFRGRFGFITGALLGCALGAGVLLLALLTTGNGAQDGLARNWSTWKPATVDTFGGAQEIARHIERTYRDDRRKQLVTIRGGPIAVGPIPLTVAIPVNGNIEVLDGAGVQYTLSGLGKEGRLRGTKPSRERHRLLRREALELALYSFRYLPDVTMVVTLLPPAPTAEHVQPQAKEAAGKGAAAFQKQALFYRPGDLGQQLEVPLKLTMTPKPPAIDDVPRDEAQRIDSLTLSNMFEYDRTQGQDGRAYLVLERPS